MKRLAMLRSWIAGVFGRPAFERDMDEELRFHLERVIEQLVESGVPAAEAQRRAALAFGGVESRKEECRQARGRQLVDELRGAVGYPVRALRRPPAFTAVAVTSLALGIGANTALFSLMEAALWKPVPVRDAAQLRVFSWVSGPRQVMNSTWGNWVRTPTGSRASTSFSFPAYQTL